MVRTWLISIAFFPNIERNDISVNLEFPAGTPDKKTEESIMQLKGTVQELNNQYKNQFDVTGDIIQDLEIQVGPGSNVARAQLYLVPAEERNISSFEVVSDLREKVGTIAGARKLTFETRSPFGKPISISISGRNYERLRDAKKEIKGALQDMETIRDISDNDQEDQPEIEVNLSTKGRLLGLNLLQVIGQIRNGFFGYESQRLQIGTNEVRVWVKYDIENRKDIEDLKRMRIRTREGEYPLGTIANLEDKKGLLAITHKDGKREIRIEADVANTSISAPDQIQRLDQEILPPIMSKYPGVNYTFEGQVRQSRKLLGSSMKVAPVFLLIMFFILVITFRSYSQTFALLIMIPFGLIGAIWGHGIHGLPLSLLSLMGFIALIGILFNDGLVFINTLNQELKAGIKYDNAVINTGLSRFRPLVLTTITTAAGLGPLIVEPSIQAQFLKPMAITVAYGLMVGSFLISTLLPLLLILFNRSKVYAYWLFTGKKPTPEMMERAVRELKNNEKDEE